MVPALRHHPALPLFRGLSGQITSQMPLLMKGGEGGGRSGCELNAVSLQVGAHIYARATVLVFIIVTTVLVSVFVSFFVAAPLEVTESSVWNATGHGTANYSGFRRRTLEGLFRLFDGASSCSRLHGGLHHRCHVQGRTGIMAGSKIVGSDVLQKHTPVISCWTQINVKVL